jgi:hypothetical protein
MSVFREAAGEAECIGVVVADDAGRLGMRLRSGEYRIEIFPAGGLAEVGTRYRMSVVHGDGENSHLFEIPRPR